jgi:hypothetical protein
LTNINDATTKKPGITLAMNSFPMDTLATYAYIIMLMEGGNNNPRDPAADIF